VVLNLALGTEHCRAIGVEGHVCELQLTTRGFVECQVRSSPEAHWVMMHYRCSNMYGRSLKAGGEGKTTASSVPGTVVRRLVCRSPPSPPTTRS
jgi:hypothetical protein